MVREFIQSKNNKEMMSQKMLMDNINRDDVWDSAKHDYASILLETYDSEDTRKFLWDKFKTTGDYYYCSILKG
jgi:ATP-dependent Lon protease